MDTVQLVELLAIGLAAGVLGGLLGVGGSIVMIPAMTEAFGPDQHLYQAAAMIVNFFVVVPAVYQHVRAGAVDRSTVLRLMPLGLVAVLVGVALSELSVFSGAGEPLLRGAFGLFLVSLCGVDIYRLLVPGPKGTEAPDLCRPSWCDAAIVSVPTGIVAGLFGVGGGALAVPLQRRFLNMPIRRAIANSASVIIATSLVGATAKNYAYLVDHDGSLRALHVALALIPTAIMGSLFGSRLTHRIRVRTVKIAFFALLAVVAVRMVYGAIQAVLTA